MPVIPLIGVASSIWLTTFLTSVTWLRFSIWLLIGLVIYGRLRLPPLAPERQPPLVPRAKGSAQVGGERLAHIRQQRHGPLDKPVGHPTRGS